MLKLLSVCLINPGTDRTMCTRMRKNVNFTDELLRMTCSRCIDTHSRNHEWWAHKYLLAQHTERTHASGAKYCAECTKTSWPCFYAKKMEVLYGVLPTET